MKLINTLTKTILFIGDDDNIDYYTGIYTEKIKIRKIIMKSYVNKSTVFRHLNYIKTAIIGLLASKKVEHIIFWQQYIALYFVFFAKLIPGYKKKIYLYYIIYKPPKIKFINIIKENIFLYVINNHNVVKSIFFSGDDYLYPKIVETKKIIIDFSIRVNSEVKVNEKENNTIFTDYYFSGGTSNRNYKKIIRVLTKLDENLIICCKPKNIKGITLSNNIKVFYNKYDDEFEDLIKNSKGLILAFENTNVLSGQLVMLKAMKFGKMIFLENCKIIHSGKWDINTKNFIKVFENEEQLLDLILKFERQNRFIHVQEEIDYYNYLTASNIYKPIFDEILGIK